MIGKTRRLGWASLAVLSVMGTAYAANVLIELNASALPTGAVAGCRASGTVGGELVAGGVQSLTAGNVSGRKAVTFAGADWLVSSFATPASVTGTNAYTVAVWAFNPAIAAEECLVMWAPRGTEWRAAQLNYGQSKDFGAVTHWGKPDIGYEGGVPASNAWHHLVVTFTGGSNGEERVYVDGVLNATETKTLDLWGGGRIHLGSAGGERGFSGSLAGVQFYDRALSAEAVAGLAAAPGRAAGPALVDVEATTLADGRLSEWPNRGTLGGTFTRSSVPRRGLVENRAALQFEGWQNLIATEPLPAALGGAAPFTVEATVFNPEPGRGETLLSFSASNAPPVCFNVGRSSSAGAFSAGAGAGLAYASRPSTNAWQRIAWTYSGAPDSLLTVFVDGENAGEGRVPFAVGAGARLVVGGAGWDGAWDRFSGALARLSLLDGAVSPYALRHECGLTAAFNPTPRPESVVEALQQELRWERGTEGVASYRVYLARDRAAVEQRDATVLKGTLAAATTAYGPVPLQLGQRYYWRVDQLDASGSNAWPGPVWAFSVDAGLASKPEPRHATANTPDDLRDLKWSPGRFASRQFLRFGTSEAEVSGSPKATFTMGGDASHWTLPAVLQPGTRYYWRVDSENGEQPASTGAVWAFRTRDTTVSNDLTFFVVSDTHYAMDPGSYAGVRRTIDVMNWLPGETWPGELGGGTVRTPRGVLHGGDMINDGGAPDAAAVWRLFTGDFGVQGEGRLCYPVFEAVGNHDAGDGCPPQEGVKARNRERHGLSAVSSNGLHYAWDWGRVHFVCVNKYAGSSRDPAPPFNQDWNDPTHSLEFLADDLSRNVGSSGRPVILYQHYGWDGFSAGWGWWSETDRTNTWRVIKPYNVVAYLHGHTHAATFMKWDGRDFHKEGQQMPAQGLDIIGCGSGNHGPDGPGVFMVFQLTDKDLRVAERNGSQWGVQLKIPILATSLDERLGHPVAPTH